MDTGRGHPRPTGHAYGRWGGSSEGHPVSLVGCSRVVLVGHRCPVVVSVLAPNFAIAIIMIHGLCARGWLELFGGEGPTYGG